MTTPRQPYEDRLIESALREKFRVGRPPDVSEHILFAARNRAPQAPEANGRWLKARVVALFAVSTCWLVVAGVLSWAITKESRKIAGAHDVRSSAARSHRALSIVLETQKWADQKWSESLPEATSWPATTVDAESQQPTAQYNFFKHQNTPPLDESRAMLPRSFGVEERVESSAPLKLAVTPRIIVDEQSELRGVEQALRADAEVREVESVALPFREGLGSGPGEGGDRYARIVENPFLRTTDSPLSTFSIDVDTASYSKVRMYLLQHRQLPPADAVRIEELVNYFDYEYEGPRDEHPFSAHLEAAECPWSPKHRLVRIALKGREVATERPASNLVFLLDVSGSMDEPNKLPLVQQGMKMVVRQLGENDRVAIVVYAGAAGLVLPSTPGTDQATIVEAIDRLHAGGSTNGGEGIRLAYQTALDHFLPGGVNRVILCTDGDFNVGVTSTGELTRLAEAQARAGVFLSVLGFGMGNHNDTLLEELSGKANGNYAFIDTENEARKVLVKQMSGTLVTIATDVKIQVEFNPAQVAAYRLIGYENRMLAAADFNDDKKDAGEIGAGHTVTALFEIVPTAEEQETEVATPLKVDDLKYQKERKLTKAARSGELLTLKLRYKQPDGDTSTLMTTTLAGAGGRFSAASRDFQFAAAVAAFGMILRGSQYHGTSTLDAIEEIAESAQGADRFGYRAEFLEMVKAAKRVRGQ